MSTPKPTITSQHTMAKVNLARAEQARVNRLSQFAIPLGCVLRDKFDFSEEKHFKDWAEMAWKAAAAFAAKEGALVDPANSTLMEAVNEHNELVQIEAEALKKAAPLKVLPDIVNGSEGNQ